MAEHIEAGAAAPSGGWMRVVFVDEPDGLVAIQRIDALLRSGGERPPRVYRARGGTTLTRRQVLGDEAVE